VTGFSALTGVEVTFEHAPARRFDLIIGADGVHSGVRALAFGPHARFARFLGYYHAGYTMANPLGLDHTGVIYNEPGRGVMITSGRNPTVAHVGLTFAAERIDPEPPDRARTAQLLAHRYAEVGWEMSRLLDGLRAATDLYFAPFDQIRLRRWSRGRVVLLGDAAWTAGPGGSGTGLAMAAAYVLAAELAAAPADYATALTRYERVIRKAATIAQRQARGTGPFLAPPTAAKIRRRNRVYRVLTSPPLAGLLGRMTTSAARGMDLRRYPLGPPSGAAAQADARIS
jgi:2-polyprenyl-6-methoxyphenol hydroxylase-like FAD-dependent oxidoreductase